MGLPRVVTARTTNGGRHRLYTIGDVAKYLRETLPPVRQQDDDIVELMMLLTEAAHARAVGVNERAFDELLFVLRRDRLLVE